jgi:hypothetical protein
MEPVRIGIADGSTADGVVDPVGAARTLITAAELRSRLPEATVEFGADLAPADFDLVATTDPLALDGTDTPAVDVLVLFDRHFADADRIAQRDTIRATGDAAATAAIDPPVDRGTRVVEVARADAYFDRLSAAAATGAARRAAGRDPTRLLQARVAELEQVAAARARWAARERRALSEWGESLETELTWHRNERAALDEERAAIAAERAQEGRAVKALVKLQAGPLGRLFARLRRRGAPPS